MTTEEHAPSGSLRRRPRWRSWLELSLIGAVLTFIGLAPGGLPQVVLFPQVQGLGNVDPSLLDEIKKLGGEAHFMERTPGFLGLFGGHDLLHFSFNGKPFDDTKLDRFVRTYGDRVWGLDLRNTGVTDRSMRYLAGLPHVRHLVLGNEDLSGFPGVALPENKVTDAGLVYLKGVTSLQNLNLDGLPVTDAGLDAVKDLPNLGGLYLFRTQVRGPALGRLKSLPNLAVLYLDESALTDEGLGHIKGATNLQILSLVGVPLTAQGLTHLKALPKLNRLDIKRCGLSDEDLDDFQVACPQVKLE